MALPAGSECRHRAGDRGRDVLPIGGLPGGLVRQVLTEKLRLSVPPQLQPREQQALGFELRSDRAREAFLPLVGTALAHESHERAGDRNRVPVRSMATLAARVNRLPEPFITVGESLLPRALV